MKLVSADRADLLTSQMFQFAGIEIPEAGAAETESTDPAVPLRVIDIGFGTGGTMRWLSAFPRLADFRLG